MTDYVLSEERLKEQINYIYFLICKTLHKKSSLYMPFEQNIMFVLFTKSTMYVKYINLVNHVILLTFMFYLYLILLIFSYNSSSNHNEVEFYYVYK